MNLISGTRLRYQELRHNRLILTLKKNKKKQTQNKNANRFLSLPSNRAQFHFFERVSCGCVYESHLHNKTTLSWLRRVTYCFRRSCWWSTWEHYPHPPPPEWVTLCTILAAPLQIASTDFSFFVHVSALSIIFYSIFFIMLIFLFFFSPM